VGGWVAIVVSTIVEYDYNERRSRES